MTYTPYGELPGDEELKNLGAGINDGFNTIAPEVEAAEAEQKQLEQTQVEEQADPATAEQQP